MLASIGSGMLVSVFVEGTTWKELFYTMIMGYHSSTDLAAVFNGGGLISMVEVVFIVGISSVYSGIFEDTKMLESFQNKIEILAEKIGRFPTMVIVGLALIMIFCNQTLATIMGNDMMRTPYHKSGATDYELASDIQNSIIVLSAIVPWSIACSVPLGMMGVGLSAMPYAFFVYLMPLAYGLTKLTKWKFYDRTQ
jgi:NhaC family Na+:H+ antiporter